ncbi:TAXI family TRAP transporter solute-binding subunit [Bradyrhizobium sp. URHD0069]|uniref:TAXI family TRAP transporter solute-binding subunit n=1 Tax=Bradyrhizobium sp. URHD0069 TaxID=1380355 RepID=UPI000AD0FB20|nr:TAXI family TRAP transporter solute-binding subunit [Bradyrhizobium sp. URHD0069]
MDSIGMPTRMPRWLRVVLVAGVVVLVTGAGLFAYRWYYRPTTLTIAVGSLDGEAGRIVSAIASRLVATNAGVRLNMIETSSPLEAANAFSSGKTDLAVVRGDVGDLSQAQAVIVVAHAVALLIAPPGSPIADVADLKRATVGVVAGETNRKIVSVLTDEYNLSRANTKFKDLAPPEARRALESKEVRAILVVLPLTEKYLSLVRGLFHQNSKAGPVLIPIESAAAIAEKERAYESFDVPKGTLRGSPPLPNDDLTTLRVTFYLVAKKELDADLIAEFTKTLMSVRRDLLGELPILAQVAAPSTDPDAYLPVHPGAAAFYNGTQQSFLDKWGNAIFLTPMIFGALVSVLAAAWKFLRAGEPRTGEPALDSLYTLGRRIRTTEAESDLSEIEREIDRVLQAQRGKAAAGDEGALDVATLNVAAHRLQSLIHDRRTLLAMQPDGKSRA